MAITPALQSYMDRRKKNQPRNVAGQAPNYYPPSYSNVAEDITPETPQGKYQPFTGSRANRGFLGIPDGLAELDPAASLEREGIHGKQTKLKNDRKYKKHLDLLKSQGTTPVLDMDMGKGKDSENQDEWMRLIGEDEDKRNQAEWKALFEKEEEEKDDWWSKIKEAFDFDFGGGGMLSGTDGGKDEDKRNQEGWKALFEKERVKGR